MRDVRSKVVALVGAVLSVSCFHDPSAIPSKYDTRPPRHVLVVRVGGDAAARVGSLSRRSEAAGCSGLWHESSWIVDCDETRLVLAPAGDVIHVDCYAPKFALCRPTLARIEAVPDPVPSPAPSASP